MCSAGGDRDHFGEGAVTVQYMPPERYRAFTERKELRAVFSYDIWALGVCLFRLMGDTPLFTSDVEALEQLKKVLTGDTSFLQQRLQSLPRAVQRFLSSMLEVHAVDRPGQASELLQRAFFAGGATVACEKLATSNMSNTKSIVAFDAFDMDLKNLGITVFLSPAYEKYVETRIHEIRELIKLRLPIPKEVEVSKRLVEGGIRKKVKLSFLCKVRTSDGNHGRLRRCTELVVSKLFFTSST